MFREPVARLVASYYFCRNVQGDPMCMRGALDPRSVSLAEWAEHWGNSMLRSLLLHPALAREVLPDEEPCGAGCEAERAARRHAGAWQMWKQALRGADDPRTERGRATVALVRRHLRGEGVPPLFDAFGVTERWAQSCMFFDRVAPLQASTWLLATSRNLLLTGRRWKEEPFAREHALNDTRVLNAISGDLDLYHNTIMPLFDERRKVMGIDLVPR